METNTGQGANTGPNVPPPHKNRITTAFLLLVIVLGIIALVYNYLPQQKPPFSTENVTVSNTNNQVPAGFPTDIPVELNNVSAGSTLNYPDRNAVLYSVSYFSVKQLEELYALYGAYLKTAGYKIASTNKSATVMIYQATKDNNDLSIVISSQSGHSVVTVSYLKRS